MKSDKVAKKAFFTAEVAEVAEVAEKPLCNKYVASAPSAFSAVNLYFCGSIKSDALAKTQRDG